jgi:hypothetical protein
VGSSPGNYFGINLGKNNGSGPNDLFIDLGDFGTADGPGNPGGNPPNNGIQAPGNLDATTTSGTLTGTGDIGDSIFVYATYTSQDDIKASLGSTTVDMTGHWSVSVNTLPVGQCVTANQTDASNNGSEMATAVAVGGGSCVLHPTTEITAGPAEGTSTSDPTPTFGFSSPESGTTIECKMDGDAFSTCPGGFITSADLPDGVHTFTVRGAQTPSNPGLGPDLGAPVIRTFLVDTTAPLVSFISGPTEGATIDTSSASIGFGADEQPVTFECAVDGGSFSACTSPLALSGLSDGAHSVQVRATDPATNVGPVATRNFSVKVPVAGPPAPPAAGPTGQRAAALKKCKKKKSAKARKKCKAKAKKLPL